MRIRHCQNVICTWSRHLYYLRQAGNTCLGPFTRRSIYPSINSHRFSPCILGGRGVSDSAIWMGKGFKKHDNNNQFIKDDDHAAASTDDIEDYDDYVEADDIHDNNTQFIKDDDHAAALTDIEDYDDYVEADDDDFDETIQTDYVGIDRAVGRLAQEQQIRFSQSPDSPVGSKVLKVTIIGAPNSGKSSLINSLMGWKVNGVSKKVHTTEKNALCMYTQGNTQIVFIDTPGVMTSEARRKHSCSIDMEEAPEQSVVDADIIGIIIDCANTWERKFHEKVLQILHENSDKPSFLILNKTDILRDLEETLTVTRNLTNGIVAGEMFGRNPINLHTASEEEMWKDEMGFEKLFKKLQKKHGILDMSNQIHSEELNPIVIETEQANIKLVKGASESVDTPANIAEDSYQKEFLEEILSKNNSEKRHVEIKRNDSNIISSSNSQSSSIKPVVQFGTWANKFEEIEKKKYKKPYWSEFDAVFPISALTGDGIGYIVEFLNSRAKPGQWLYHSSVVTDQDPIELAKMCVRQSLLDHVDGYVAYVVDINILYWEVNSNSRLDVVMEVVAQNSYEMGLLLANENRAQAIPSGLGKHERRQIDRNFNIAQQFVTPSSKIAKISSDARQALLDAFRCEVKFKLVSRLDKSLKRKSKAIGRHNRRILKRPIQQ